MTEQEARLPFEQIDAQNRTLCAEIVRADFDGDHLLDPTTNQAQHYIHAAAEAVATYPQGAFPLDFASAAVASTAELLAKCRARYGVPIVKPMEQTFNRWFGLWFYNGSPMYPADLFLKKLFQHENDLLDAICTANVKVAEIENARLTPTRRKSAATKSKAKGKCVGRGPQTDFKQSQREVFKKFLERRPVTPSVSVITRAHQCWNEHKEAWDAAAKRKIGYYDHKNLARAI